MTSNEDYHYFLKAKEYGFDFKDMFIEARTEKVINSEGEEETIFHNIRCSKNKQQNAFKTITFNEVIVNNIKFCRHCRILVATKSDSTVQSNHLRVVINLIKLVILGLEYKNVLQKKKENNENLTFSEVKKYFLNYHDLYLSRDIILYYCDVSVRLKFKEILKELTNFFENELTDEVFEKAAVMYLLKNSEYKENLFETTANLTMQSHKNSNSIIAKTLKVTPEDFENIKLTIPSRNHDFYSYDLIFMAAYRKYNFKNENVFKVPGAVSYLFFIFDSNSHSTISRIFFDVETIKGNVSDESIEILNTIYPLELINYNIKCKPENGFKGRKDYAYRTLLEAYEHAEILTLN